jgi:uncharacterized protein YpbB
MADYAYAKRCRRGFILRYFGESAPLHCGNCDACAPAARKPRRQGQSSSAETSWDLLTRGHSLDEVARMRGITAETALGHLVFAAKQGRPVALDVFVPPERQARIRAAAARLPNARLGELKRAVADASYGELRLTLAVKEPG